MDTPLVPSPSGRSFQVWPCVIHVPSPSKVYHRSICGAVLPNEPKPVLQHQMSDVRRRPYANSTPAPAQLEADVEPAQLDLE
jgi:hypothetical protein